MGDPYITIEMDGGPYDGQTHTLGPPAAKAPGTPDPAIFGVPLHPTDTPGHYKVKWTDLVAHREQGYRAADYLDKKIEIIQSMLEEGS